jgi:hypothetical protein
MQVAPNVSAQPGRGTGEAARTANQLRSATEAAGDAGGNAPSVVRSAFADAPGQQPREEGEGGSHVEQPGQLLDKVCRCGPCCWGRLPKIQCCMASKEGWVSVHACWWHAWLLNLWSRRQLTGRVRVHAWL